jgi:hypothetical protein
MLVDTAPVVTNEYAHVGGSVVELDLDLDAPAAECRTTLRGRSPGGRMFIVAEG